MNVAEAYLKLKDQFISYQEINHETHGKFIQGMRPQQKHPGVILDGKRIGAKKLEPIRASHALIRIGKIDGSSIYKMRKFYENEKARIEEKISAGHKLTGWEKKISGLTYRRFNNFFSVIDLEKGHV